MYGNIIFIGGIHGVGKSTICRNSCASHSLNYLSASEVLKWNDVRLTENNKNVPDLNITQERLISGLRQVVDKKEKYILDGHFCLFNLDGIVQKIPIETFRLINPIEIVVIVGSPMEIANRLVARDGKNYSHIQLDKMQEIETQYGKKVANLLEIPFAVYEQGLGTGLKLINI